MSLTRHWIPSPNYSGGGKKRLIVVHTTEGWTTSPNGMYDAAYYFQGPVGASASVCIDNYHPGHVTECVSRGNGAWTQCNFNSVSVSVEQCAYASWSYNTWINDKMSLLKNTAAWIGEESRALGIPITRLTASQAQGGAAGVCGHSDLGSGGCGHSDPGGGYPWDLVLDMARGQVPEERPPAVEELPEDEDMTYFTVLPKSMASYVQEISLNGMHKNVGILTDASTHPNTGVEVRFHMGPRRWHVAEVWSDNGGDKGHEKAVYNTPEPFDGATVRRIDDNETAITINFGK